MGYRIKDTEERGFRQEFIIGHQIYMFPEVGVLTITLSLGTLCMFLIREVERPLKSTLPTCVKDLQCHLTLH